MKSDDIKKEVKLYLPNGFSVSKVKNANLKIKKEKELVFWNITSFDMLIRKSLF